MALRLPRTTHFALVACLACLACLASPVAAAGAQRAERAPVRVRAAGCIRPDNRNAAHVTANAAGSVTIRALAKTTINQNGPLASCTMQAS